MMKRYRIIKEVYFNEYGEAEMEQFTVQYLTKNIFGKSVWRTYKHTECYRDGCDKTPTRFKTFAEAEEFMFKQYEEPFKEGWKSTVVKEYVKM